MVMIEVPVRDTDTSTHTHTEMMAGVEWLGGLVRVCGRQISTGPQRRKSSLQLWHCVINPNVLVCVNTHSSFPVGVRLHLPESTHTALLKCLNGIKAMKMHDE